MSSHYWKFKGYRRYPGKGGRRIYYVQMSRAEVIERRVLYGVIAALAAMLGALVLWLASLV